MLNQELIKLLLLFIQRIRRQQVRGPPRLPRPQPRVGLRTADNHVSLWGHAAAEGKFTRLANLAVRLREHNFVFNSTAAVTVCL